MNIIKAARTALNMSQPDFSRWLADKVGRNAPFPISRVSEWENGKRSPRKNIRDICLPIVANSIANDAINNMCELLGAEKSEEIEKVCNFIEYSIVSNTK